MRVLFITRQFVIPPLGIMYLSSAAKKNGHQVDLITTAENIDNKISEFQPDILAYSIMTGDQGFYDNINKRLKEKYGLISIAGGPHPTFFNEVINDGSFDYICIGEGEQAFVKFLNRQAGEGIDFATSALPNIIGKNHKNLSILPLENDLNELPFPDRSIVYKYPQLPNSPIRHFMISRGCQFNCTYCFNESYSKLYKGKGKRVRWRSVSNVLNEIGQVLGTYPAKLVYFQDDTLNSNRPFLREFAPKYKQEINYPFHCHIRLDLLNEETVKLLSKAGCTGVHCAIESGSEWVRRELLNRHMSNEKIKWGIELLKKHGIKVMTQQMIGIGGTSIEEDIETLKLNQECYPDYAWCSIYTPYPKTALGERCLKEGWYTGDFSDIGSNFFDDSILNFSEQRKTQIANLQKIFAIAVEFPQIFTEDFVLNTIHRPGLSKDFIVIEGYKRFRKMKDRQLYGVEL